jgi:DNA-binding Xre family transcriptional regulator
MLMKVEPAKNRLNELIAARGLTYEQVAQRAGYSTVFLWQMAKGKRNIALKHLGPLSQALDCKPEDILGVPVVSSTDILDIWASIPEDRRELARQVLESFVSKGVDEHVNSGVEQGFKNNKKK